MISASEALQIILDQVKLLGTEKVLLLDAIGRALARDVVAKEDIPPFDNSSMDGFAVRSSGFIDAIADHPSILNIAGESRAGNGYKGTINEGTTVRVMTGAMMPVEADAVIPVEHVSVLANETIEVRKPVKAGQYVRNRGEDIKRGDVVLRAGHRLTPGSIGVLASLGYTQVRVFERPAVNIIATGDELVDVDENPDRGEIRDSSSYALAAHVINAGGTPHVHGIVPDKRKKLRRSIAVGLDTDLLLITGGVSVGRYDYVKDVLADVGVDVKFWKVNIKPGMPLVFGTRRRTLVFGLPGNPVSTGVTFLQFVRPALLKMAGVGEVFPLRHPAVLDEDLTKNDGKRHYLRGIVSRGDGGLHVVTTGTQSSGAVSSMAKANCLIVVPEEVTSLKNGSLVDVELL